MAMRILVTGVGGPTPRSFVKSIKNFGSFYRYEFIGTACNPLAIGLYQHELFNATYLAQDFMDVMQGDASFDMTYKQYEFEDDLIFLRDVDELPIVMKESDLLERRG